MGRPLLRTVITTIVVLTLAGAYAAQPLAAVSAPPDSVATAAPAADRASDKTASGQKLGIELAEALSQATGIAISPLLGIGVVGVWQYFQAPEEARAELPWYAQVWFWLPALVLVLLLIAKEPLLGWAPVIKKPLDALEVVENTVSGVVGSAVAIPLILAVFKAHEVLRSVEASASSGLPAAPTLLTAGIGESATGFAGWAGYALLSAVLILGYFAVWLASHAINVLILLSPFGPFDMLLRAVKLGLLLLVLGATLINAYLGALVCLLLLYLATRVAGWSFRLMVFGTVFALDVLTFSHRRSERPGGPPRAFSSTFLKDAPLRSYGRVERDSGGELVFTYRPWLVLPSRRCRLPAATYHLDRGLVSPDLAATHGEGKRTLDALVFPPRYRGHEEALARALVIEEIRDGGVLRGFRSAIAWFKSMLRGPGAPELEGR